MMIRWRPYHCSRVWFIGMIGLAALTAGCAVLPEAKPKISPQSADSLSSEPTDTILIPSTSTEPRVTQISPGDSTAVPTATLPQIIVTTAESGSPGTIPESLLGQIVQDLADRLGLSSDAVQVVLVEPATWNDSSLGCPEKGMAYLQVITHGYRVILEAQGQQYDYRMDTLGDFRLCSR
jgi:hypothetical protein